MRKINLMLFAAKTGHFPVYNNVFKIGITGRASLADDIVVIAGMETFAPAVDNNVEEWYAMEDEGWVSRMITGKALGISLSGKRIYGDEANDYIAGMMMNSGETCESMYEWVFASGAKLSGNCIINLTTPAGGDTNKVDSLEFEILSDGKPVFTAAV